PLRSGGRQRVSRVILTLRNEAFEFGDSEAGAAADVDGLQLALPDQLVDEAAADRQHSGSLGHGDEQRRELAAGGDSWGTHADKGGRGTSHVTAHAATHTLTATGLSDLDAQCR